MIIHFREVSQEANKAKIVLKCPKGRLLEGNVLILFLNC